MEELRPMNCHYWTILAAASLSCAVFAQQPEVRSTSEDALRRELTQSQKAFLETHPNLERDINTAKPGDLRKQISESRRLADNYSNLEIQYYQMMIELSAAGLDRIQSGKSFDPALVDRQLESNRDRRIRVDLDIESMQAKIKRIEAMKPSELVASPSAQGELENARDQIAALAAIQRALDGEASELRSLGDRGVAVEKGRTQIVTDRKEQIEGFKKLKALVEKKKQQMKDYFGALEKHVNERDAGAKPRPKS